MRHFSRKLFAFCLPLLVLLAIPVLFVCCTAKWLPDSKGFVYVTGKKVVLFDLKSKKGKTLATMPTQFGSAAILSSGDRIAVSHIRPKDKIATLQITIYDFHGKKKHESPSFELKSGGKLNVPVSETFVSPDAKRVATFWMADQSVVIYDVERRKFQSIKNVMPIHALLMSVGIMTDVNPVTNKGIVVIDSGKKEEKESIFAFYQWGKEKPRRFTIEPTTKKVIDQITEKTALLTIPQWRMGVLFMRIDKGLLSIDPRDFTIDFQEDAESMRIQRRAKADGVKVFFELNKNAQLQITPERELQLWTRKNGGATKSLAKLGKEGFASVTPSPDKKRFVVRTLGEKGRIMVIDADGETIVSIKVPFLPVP